MAAIVRMDELVKDYLLYRGLTATLRALEIELKNEKDKGFRVSEELTTYTMHTRSFDGKLLSGAGLFPTFLFGGSRQQLLAF